MKHNCSCHVLCALRGIIFFATLAASAGALAAAKPSFSIISPQANATVASPVALQINVQNSQIGQPIDGLDHLHISVDNGQPVALYQNQRVEALLPAGRHIIWVDLAGPTHESLLPPESVTFTVR